METGLTGATGSSGWYEYSGDPKFKDVTKRVEALQSLQGKSASTVKKAKNISYL